MKIQKTQAELLDELIRCEDKEFSARMRLNGAIHTVLLLLDGASTTFSNSGALSQPLKTDHSPKRIVMLERTVADAPKLEKCAVASVSCAQPFGAAMQDAMTTAHRLKRIPLIEFMS